MVHHRAASPATSGDKDFLNEQKNNRSSGFAQCRCERERGQSSSVFCCPQTTQQGVSSPQATPLSSGAACELFKPGGHHPLEVNTANENPLAKLTLMGTRKKVQKVKSYIICCTGSQQRQHKPVVETLFVCKIHRSSFEDYILSIILTSPHLKWKPLLKGVNYVVRDETKLLVVSTPQYIQILNYNGVI